ncbi:hypothetical protein T09_12578 [Trichinella sp. T9]|nr:hypothetical protein T09_12578 [Trichinella sp. T9]
MPVNCPNKRVEEVRSQDAQNSQISHHHHRHTSLPTAKLQRLPTPLMHIHRPSASSIVPVSLSEGSPPEVICQRDSGITETTAPMSNSKETLVPLSLPFTHGVSPACSPAIDNILRFPGLPLYVPLG